MRVKVDRMIDEYKSLLDKNGKPPQEEWRMSGSLLSILLDARTIAYSREPFTPRIAIPKVFEETLYFTTDADLEIALNQYIRQLQPRIDDWDVIKAQIPEHLHEKADRYVKHERQFIDIITPYL